MRTSGNFSLGATYSTGKDIITITFSGNLSYRKEKSYFNLSWDNNNSYQGDSLNSSKADATFAMQRLIKRKWSAEVAVTTSQNTELGTKLRIGLSLMGLNDISYNIWNRLYAGAGFALQRETPYDDSGEKNDLSGLFAVVWKVYKYTVPKLWVDSNISFLPYITDGGRYRASFNLNPKISLFADYFKFGFALYFNYDSRPPSDLSSTNDYGINLQLTYTFH